MKRRRKGRHLSSFDKFFQRFIARLLKSIQTPVGITVVVGLFLILIIAILDFKYLETDDGRDVLIEAHGLIFDVFVFGVLLAYLNKFLEKRQKVERYKEEIDDFRGWDEKEAKYRIVGLIKRLNKIGNSRVNLSNCFLAHADLHGVNLNKANLKNADLQDADLSNADFTGADFGGANLKGANLTNSVLRGVNLANADLSESNLTNASLWRANLMNADLHGAELYKTNLMETDLTNVNFEGVDVSKANMDRAKVDSENTPIKLK
ncbi:pentapeptide repeat-containing protein [Flexithrix dorotheae]|uniref:pentapeptide repeat-containing protein n=1 Tax=Flexithrix dorotheae TaxID=70993 RepID=UPI0003AA98A6|nr:pentapeptide repeat-containing protein [Flexithrix dorotheae]